MLRTAQCSHVWLPASVGPISLPSTDVNFKDGDVEGVYKVRISHSIINIECEYEPDKQHYHYPVLNNSATFVRAALNLVSFALAQPHQGRLSATRRARRRASRTIVRGGSPGEMEMKR